MIRTDHTLQPKKTLLAARPARQSSLAQTTGRPFFIGTDKLHWQRTTGSSAEAATPNVQWPGTRAPATPRPRPRVPTRVIIYDGLLVDVRGARIAAHPDALAVPRLPGPRKRAPPANAPRALGARRVCPADQASAAAARGGRHPAGPGPGTPCSRPCRRRGTYCPRIRPSPCSPHEGPAGPCSTR